MLHFDMNLYYVYLESCILVFFCILSCFMCCFYFEFVCLLFCVSYLCYYNNFVSIFTIGYQLDEH